MQTHPSRDATVPQLPLVPPVLIVLSSTEN
jgi:hypothetical protein